MRTVPHHVWSICQLLNIPVGDTVLVWAPSMTKLTFAMVIWLCILRLHCCKTSTVGGMLDCLILLLVNTFETGYTGGEQFSVLRGGLQGSKEDKLRIISRRWRLYSSCSILSFSGWVVGYVSQCLECSRAFLRCSWEMKTERACEVHQDRLEAMCMCCR